MATKKIQILDSMIKQAENANTLGGRSASYFAVASEVNELQQLVGDTSVSTQISTAVEAITADDLGVYVQDTEPTEAVEGDIWIDSSADSGDYVPINHAHNDATASTSGFMSAADKVKLDSLVSGVGGNSGVYAQNDEPIEATNGSLWIDMDAVSSGGGASCGISITGATVGQTVVVKAVDANGVPTEWEVVDPWVIASSTEGSNKKFKITVDDNGTMTVTEVV